MNELTDKHLEVLDFARQMYVNTYEADPDLRDAVAEQDPYHLSQTTFMMGYLAALFPEDLVNVEVH